MNFLARQKRWFVALTLFLCSAGLLLITDPGSSAVRLEKNKLKVGISPASVSFLPLFMAFEERLFQNQGLEVEFFHFRSGTDNTLALLSKSVDLIAGAFPESVLTPSIKGMDIKMFYGLCNLSVYKWYSKPAIKSIEDAKGKKFSVSKIGSQSDFLTRWVVRRAGLDPEKDIQVVQGGGPMERFSALAQGAVDIATLTEPGSFIAQRQGFNLLLSLDQFVKDYPNEVYASDSQFIKNNPETIKAFLRAHNKGIEILRADQGKALVVIRKYVKLTGDDALQGYLSYRDSYPTDGSPALEGIDLVQEIAIMAGEMKNKVPLTKVIDYTYINMFKK